MFVASRSDTYKVSMQQTVYSALSRVSGAPKLVLMSGFNLAHAASFRFRVNLKDLYKVALFGAYVQRREGAEWGSKMLCLLSREATRIEFPYNKQCIAHYCAVLNPVQRLGAYVHEQRNKHWVFLTLKEAEAV